MSDDGWTDDATGCGEARPQGRPAGHALCWHLEISDGHGAVASADVTIPCEPDRPAFASLRAIAGHLAPGARTRLVDAVLDLPELRQGVRLHAAFPLGDSETLLRFQERCTCVSVRPAGTTVLLEAITGPQPAGRLTATAG